MAKQNKFYLRLAAFVAAVVILLAAGPFYIVNEGDQAVVTRFGQIVKSCTSTGLYFKIPFLDVVTFYPAKILSLEGDQARIPTKENQFIIVDTTSRWKISDPALFYQSFKTLDAAYNKLSDVIDSSTRTIITRNRLSEIVRSSNLINEEKDSADSNQLAGIEGEDSAEIEALVNVNSNNESVSKGSSALCQEMADDARKMAKEYITSKYSDKYYENRYFKTKASAQDAHEAIRPSNILNSLGVYDTLTKDEQKLYTLILNRFLASQMATAIYDTTRVKIEVDNYIFIANGSVVKFDGFMKLYTEGKDDKDKTKKEDVDEEENTENILPELEVGDILKQDKIYSKQKFTEPPARFTEASLVKTLEEKGIGRPSTYAPTISTIEERTYVERQNKYLVPTELGEIVNELMEENFANIVDEKFTAKMENELDMVAEDKVNYVEMLKEFYGPFEK